MSADRFECVAGTVAKEGESMVAKNPDDLTHDNSTLIEFSLTAAGDGPRLSVAESGFAALPHSEEARAKVLADNSAGLAAGAQRGQDARLGMTGSEAR